MKSSKVILWLLVASIALNVFLIGSLAPHLWERDSPPPPPPGPARFLSEMMANLPPDDAAILRKSIEAHKDDLTGDDMTGPQNFHERFEKLLRTEPFDAQSFNTLTTEFHDKRNKEGRAVGAVLSEALPQMSHAGRQAVADFRPPRPPK